MLLSTTTTRRQGGLEEMKLLTIIVTTVGNCHKIGPKIGVCRCSSAAVAAPCLLAGLFIIRSLALLA